MGLQVEISLSFQKGLGSDKKGIWKLHSQQAQPGTNEKEGFHKTSHSSSQSKFSGSLVSVLFKDFTINFLPQCFWQVFEISIPQKTATSCQFKGKEFTPRSPPAE